MKICLICEASYPYVTGGVSSWVQMLITSMPEHEFCVLSIVVDRAHGGNFKYTLPDNLKEIHEIYLQDDDYVRKGKRQKLSRAHREAFRSFVLGEDIDWHGLFRYFYGNDISVNALLMGAEMYDIIKVIYFERYNRLPFSDFLWTYRSMLLPMCLLLKNKLPEADIYHSASTGYAGALACMAKLMKKRPAIITEHGIYTREREEDIIRSPDFNGLYKDLWIEHFYKLSGCAYKYADRVISLFENARSLQLDLGCSEEKTLVIPNGVTPEMFDDAPVREEDGAVVLGIVARIAPIKDIKTLINSYAAAKSRVSNLKLYIMGGVEADYEEYYDECKDLVNNLGLTDVSFTGNIDVLEYMGKLDIIILTSISEGQPLSLLEAMSARKPCIATRVGDCEGILLGGRPDDAPCGIITSIMSVEQISNAIVALARDKERRTRYGEEGRRRVEERYQRQMVIDRYKNLYKELNTEK